MIKQSFSSLFFCNGSKACLKIPRRLLATSLAFGCLTAPALASSSDSAEARFIEGLAAYEVGHYSQAFNVFSLMAEQGHLEAARIASQMWRYGPRLYRTDFKAPADQISRWAQLWIPCGRTTRAAYMPTQQRP